jgi:hypothetical protein
VKPPGLKHNHPRDGTRSWSLLSSHLNYSLGVATGECHSPLCHRLQKDIIMLARRPEKTYLLWTATDPQAPR